MEAANWADAGAQHMVLPCPRGTQPYDGTVQLNKHARYNISKVCEYGALGLMALVADTEQREIISCCSIY